MKKELYERLLDVLYDTEEYYDENIQAQNGRHEDYEVEQYEKIAQLIFDLKTELGPAPDDEPFFCLEIEDIKGVLNDKFPQITNQDKFIKENYDDIKAMVNEGTNWHEVMEIAIDNCLE